MRLKVLSVILFAAASVASCSSADTPDGAELHRMRASYVIDVGDDRKLAGWADAIFIGKVLENKHEEYPAGEIPYTRFRVNVEAVLKGQVPDQVDVLQDGGYSRDGSELYLFQGDQRLGVGSTYLFVGKFDAKLQAYNLVSKYGDIPVTSEDLRNRLVERFRAAVRDQIPYRYN